MHGCTFWFGLEVKKPWLIACYSPAQHSILLETEARVFGLLFIQSAVIWEATKFRHLENTDHHVKKRQLVGQLILTRVVPKAMSNNFFHANWEQQTKESNFVNLYMFRAYLDSSSGGATVCIQHLVLIIPFRWLSAVLFGLESNQHSSQSYIRLYLLMMGIDTP